MLRIAVAMVLFSFAGLAAAADRWHALLERNPFEPEGLAKPKVPEQPPAYEFRGRSIEGEVEYFSIYNLETKKAAWITRSSGELQVANYDPRDGLVLTDISGKTIRLPLKSTAARIMSAVAVAPAPVAVPNGASVAEAASVSAVEASQSDQIPDEVRARRAQRQRLGRS